MKSLNLNQYRNLFKTYTELRVQENRSTRISFVKGHNVANSRSAVSGVCARSYSNGSWGFASSPELNQESVSSVIKTATNNALFLDSRENKNKGPLPEVPATSENDFSTKKARLSQKDLLDFAKEIDRHIETVYPELASRVVTVNCLDMEKLLVTSDGSYSHSMIPRAFISIGMSVMKDGQPIELYQPYGGFGQFEDVFTSPSDLFDEFEKQYQELIKKSQGV
ncbi:MAG: DNA gyrase modulator, partial [Bacillota bacterium]